MPTLKIESEHGKSYPIAGDQVFIGRDPANTIVLQDLGVSGFQARILRTELGYLLLEERTSTGIWVRERRVNNTFLQHGTRFRLGTTVFVFELEPGIQQVSTVPGPPPVAPAWEMVTPVVELRPLQASGAIPVPAPPAPAPPTPAPTAPARPLELDATLPALPPLQPPAPAPAPALIIVPDDDVPAWARLGMDQLAHPSDLVAELEGDDCPSCGATLVGLERFCAICSARTRHGGRRRVMLLKVIALLLVLGAGLVGAHLLTEGDPTRAGVRRAIGRVFGDSAPTWLRSAAGRR